VFDEVKSSSISKTLEPRIVGMDIMREICAASKFLNPFMRAPVIQQPDLDAPGIIANDCQKPM